ncbi:MAG: TrmH family RNA methyltransferase [Polaribacter sp.]|jgi:TrmH family RNA methyltransferase
MLSINKSKFIISLQRKKIRRDTGLFVLEGDKMAKELIEQATELIEEVFALPDWIEEQKDFLAYYKIQAQEISEKDLKKVSSLTTPNKVIAILRQPIETDLVPGFDQQLSLYLDAIQDPGNMGTILRIADWFGINNVICSPNCVDVFSPKVVQASMGAIFRVVTLSESLVNLKNRFPNMPIYGTLLEGENLYETDLERRGLIVIGNEGKGISEDNKSLITKSIAIPKGSGSNAESLNAAIATGIVCAFFSR